MSNSHFKMQEKIWAELDYRIEEQYQGLMYNCLYKVKRITKFNFEEVAEDNDFINHQFTYIFDKLNAYFNRQGQLTHDEQDELRNYVMDKLYNFLNEDVQEHRQNEKPREERGGTLGGQYPHVVEDKIYYQMDNPKEILYAIENGEGYRKPLYNNIISKSIICSRL